MPPTFVCIDLETTGLDPRMDAIIEIGLVVFRGDKVLDHWSSLVNPGRRVPPYITELTGITQEEVNSAEPLNHLLPELERRVGKRTLVAHNARFDMQFLHHNALFRSNQALDTLELATILLPTAGQYNLNALGTQLDIAVPGESRPHRALSDALKTVALFQRLLKTAVSLPYDILEEITLAGRTLGWQAVLFFEEALATASRNAFAPPADQQGENTPFSKRRKRRQYLFQAPLLDLDPLQPADPPKPINELDISAMLEHGGRFARQFPDYEHRPQQVNMARTVAEALSWGDHLLVEAGTGTGKSVAYLLPAIHWAVQNDDRVVISTNTINLQDQLISKDIPDLGQILPFDFHAAVLKGRSNYVCPRMVNALRRRGPSDLNEMRLLAKLLVWLPQSKTGERGEISLRSPGEQRAWSALNADNEGCSAEICAGLLDRCPLYRARQTAERAHIIIVNHALLLSDIVTGNNILPEYHHLIVDEAHHLESATTNGLSFEVDLPTMEWQLGEIAYNRGLGAEILGRCRAILPPDFLAPMESHLLKLQENAGMSIQALNAFFDLMEQFLREHSEEPVSQYSRRVRVTDSLHKQPSWQDVEITWEEISQRLSLLVNDLKWLEDSLDDISDSFELPDGEDLAIRTKSLRQELAETKYHIDELVFTPSNDNIYWAELSAKGNRLSLHAAPIHVGPLVDEHLFQKKRGIIMTSATLQTTSSSSNGPAGFDFIRERLHAWEAQELAVGSPFDFKWSTLLYLPTDIPEPRQPGYQRTIESSLLALCKALCGRTLLLFTAYSQLNMTAKAIRGGLNDAGTTLLQQGAGTSRQQLLETFRTSNSAVLFGTRSFWEGVDIPGPALSCVVIVKLPFDVPSDPIFAARRESFENPFYDYAVPEAVLRFRQGFGRLIRTQTDRGVVVCLDKRLLTKGYGRFFLEALPQCTIQRGSVTQLARMTAQWVNSQGAEESN